MIPRDDYDEPACSNLTCDICEGEGGWYQCLSSQEWCEANPLESGIEHSTENEP